MIEVAIALCDKGFVTTQRIMKVRRPYSNRLSQELGIVFELKTRSGTGCILPCEHTRAVELQACGLAKPPARSCEHRQPTGMLSLW